MAFLTSLHWRISKTAACLLLFTFLLVTTFSTTTAAEAVHQHDDLRHQRRRHKQRNLQSSNRDCNEEFASVTIDEIQALLDFFASSIPGDPDEEDDNLDRSRLRQLIDPSLRYNLTVAKVCLRCSEIGFQDLSTQALLSTSPYGFPSYCAVDQYGWDAPHSALVLTPAMNDNDDSTGSTGGQTMLMGELRGFVAGHVTEFNAHAGPTDLWPDGNVIAILESDALTTEQKEATFRSFVSSLVAASAGAVAILPDYIGYGESRNYDRAYLQLFPYLQAAGVTYAAAKRYVSLASSGCTVLSDVASTAGYGEGGYFAVVGALALVQNDVEVLSAKAGGAPYDLDVQLGYSISMDFGSASPPMRLGLSYFGYAFSNNFSFMFNAGRGQDALAASWTNETIPEKNVLDWFRAPDPLFSEEILRLLPADIHEIFNQGLIDLYEEAVFEGKLDACGDGFFVSESMEILCQTILEAGLWKILSADVSFPVSICHSPQDDLIAFENVPPPNLLPPFVNYYSSDIGALNPRGTHFQSLFLCALDPILHISLTPDGSNSPVLRTPLEHLPSQCGTDAPSRAPSPPDECGVTYANCKITPCCSFFECTDRIVNGMPSTVCIPSESKNKGKDSVAGPDAGGAVHRRPSTRGR